MFGWFQWVRDSRTIDHTVREHLHIKKQKTAKRRSCNIKIALHVAEIRDGLAESGHSSLLRISLLARVGSLELRDGVEVSHDRLNVGELRHIDTESLSIEHLSRKETVSQSEDVAKAVFAFGRLDSGLKGCQSSGVYPVGPWLLVVITEACTKLLEDGEVLDWLGAGINDLTEATNLRFFEGIFRK